MQSGKMGNGRQMDFGAEQATTTTNGTFDTCHDACKADGGQCKACGKGQAYTCKGCCCFCPSKPTCPSTIGNTNNYNCQATTTTTTQATTVPSNLTSWSQIPGGLYAYLDSGSCGPQGNDYRIWSWCQKGGDCRGSSDADGGFGSQCSSQVSTSACPGGVAYLSRTWKNPSMDDGCNYPCAAAWTCTSPAVWVLGDEGQTCDAACSAQGKTCDASGTKIKDHDTMKQVSSQLGDVCKSYGQNNEDMNPNVIVSSGHCEVLTDHTDTWMDGLSDPAGHYCKKAPKGGRKRFCSCS